MNWNNKEEISKLASVGPEALVDVCGMIKYTADCIIRERERLASIFESESDPSKIAAAIRDNSKDAEHFIFKYPGK